MGHTDIVKLLLKNNADVLLKDSDGKTALHKVLLYSNLPSIYVCTFLCV